MFFEIIGNLTNSDSASCLTTCVTYCASSCVCTGTEDPRSVVRTIDRLDILAEIQISAE